MCGISGVVNLDGCPADPLLLQRMVRMLEHRGPDDEGVFTDGSVGLAHRRLSIIDVAGGHQPMRSQDGAVSITFNGEIFNFIELRDQLEKKGHRFVTRSDTEVILHLYHEYGAECVQHMNGQWAFAIWDARRRRLFLSRDRLGIRPLFYTTAGRSFVFGSEIKALLAHPAVKARLDPQALKQLFTFWFAVAPKSTFENIHQLPPGHSLVHENGSLQVKRFWQIAFHEGNGNTADDASIAGESRYADELCGLMLDATRLRLRADVPVGAYLSGGLDSSITSALASKLVGGSLRTFSVAFDQPELDESTFQLQMAESLGTRHETIHCSSEDIGRAFPDLIWHMETPVLRTAPAPMFLLSRLVHDQNIKVILTGEGADEFFGGYDIFKEAKIRAFWAAQIESTRRPLLLKKLYPYLDGLQRQSVTYLQAFFKVQSGSVTDPFFSHIPRWELTAKAQMFFSRAFRAETADFDPYLSMQCALPGGFSQQSVLARAQYLEAGFLLPDYLLSSQGDRVAMAHSVEGRYPFLDYRITEFAMRLPARLKMKVLNEKYLLKRAFGGLIPASITRRPKQPYRAPDASSLIDPVAGRARSAYIEHMLSPDCIREHGVFEAAPVQELVKKAQAGRAVSFLDNAALVGIVSTQSVIDQFVCNFQEKLSDASQRTNRTQFATVCN